MADKLWLVSQNDNKGYDTFDAFVVYADNEEDARNWMPSHYHDSKPFNPAAFGGDWARSIDSVSAELLGYALLEKPSGTIVLSSFNAG